MKRRTNRADRPSSSHRYSTTERRALAALGTVTGAALATLLATCPVTVTVTVSLSPEQRTVVVGRAGAGLDDGPRPVCPVLPSQATFTR
ncbi:hypothetical protein [Streptomyces sp. NPDC047000]|uniref:hypothetical protein n=1 Tax=Streptomyces sp. NPDC047000 TaxID=3155474 RepID=UPI003403F919